MTVKDYFKDNKYVYISNVLDKKTCDFVTKHLLKLKDEGKLTKDTQCPLSYSVYGDPILDEILGSLAKPLGDQLGIELLPTYTYARVYQPGEVLKKHLDRPACEITGTLTLGHDPESEIWPIYVSNDPQDQAGTSVTIDIGDMILYRGQEVNHWRPAYIGNWQAQVFFHYVDANGPNREWAFDKRAGLGKQEREVPKRSVVVTDPKKSFVDDMVKKEVVMPKQMEQATPAIIANPIYNGVMLPSYSDKECPGFSVFHKGFNPQMMLTPTECSKLIAQAKAKYPEKSRVGSDKDGKYDPNIRRVDTYHIKLEADTKWIFDKLAACVSKANAEYYKYSLMGITHELQLLHYKSEERGFYDWHADVGPGSASTRKLSVSIMLSDPNSYEGGELIINNYGNEIEGNKELGSINMFPSYLLHTVKPVTKGERWVLVSWIHGSERFR